MDKKVLYRAHRAFAGDSCRARGVSRLRAVQTQVKNFYKYPLNFVNSQRSLGVMAYLKVKDLAAKYGISRVRIYDYIKGGRLIQADDGTVAEGEYLRLRAAIHSKAGKVIKTPKILPDIKSIPRFGPHPDQPRLPSPKEQANLEKIREQVEALQLSNAEKRREYIHRDLVRRGMSQLHAIDTNEFSQLGPRIAPMVVALLGREDATLEAQIEEVITRAVYESLEYQKRTLKDFLAQIKTEIMENGEADISDD